MKYALLIYSNGGEFQNLTEDQQKAVYDEYMQVSNSPGIVGGEELDAADTATTVRVQNGETLTTDGPLAETKEALGGFFLFEADDLDAAIEIASRIPGARTGAVEVRPVVQH